MENEVVKIDEMKMIGRIKLFHGTSPIVIIISLKKLIDGGAEILEAINKNHQNIRLGDELIKPLKDKIFRV